MTRYPVDCATRTQSSATQPFDHPNQHGRDLQSRHTYELRAIRTFHGDGSRVPGIEGQRRWIAADSRCEQGLILVRGLPAIFLHDREAVLARQWSDKGPRAAQDLLKGGTKG